MLGFVRISSQNCSFQFGVTRNNEWSQTTVSDSDASCHKGTIHWINTHPLCQYPWYTHLGTSRCAFQFSWPKNGPSLLRADEVQLIVPWNLVPYPCHLISFRPLDQSKSVTLHTFRIKKESCCRLLQQNPTLWNDSSFQSYTYTKLTVTV